ncbi:hypothetical protein POTOM_021233 [Populus tomentosa]|uniref:Uncharacterized protein n=1 Tax=Populus tomentosa TaxID=118781 RepID=A0A8X7ZTI9_POPTO|nr:hypothetical protein POTOM_021233 [Populus tomentosa]
MLKYTQPNPTFSQCPGKGKQIGSTWAPLYNENSVLLLSELVESSQCKLPFSSPDNLSLNHGFFSFSLPEGSATWPEENSPASSLGLEMVSKDWIFVILGQDFSGVGYKKVVIAPVAILNGNLSVVCSFCFSAVGQFMLIAEPADLCMLMLHCMTTEGGKRYL